MPEDGQCEPQGKGSTVSPKPYPIVIVISRAVTLSRPGLGILDPDCDRRQIDRSALTFRQGTTGNEAR